MASSEDEEDLHQCGRCKELFTCIEAYLKHKKARSCQKVDGPLKSLSTSLQIRSLSPPSVASQATPARSGSAQLSACTANDTTQVSSRRGRPRGRGRSRKGVHRGRLQASGKGHAGTRGRQSSAVTAGSEAERQDADWTTSTNINSIAEDQPISSRVRLRQGRSAPKKAWVEDYQDELDEQLAGNSGDGGEEASGGEDPSSRGPDRGKAAADKRRQDTFFSGTAKQGTKHCCPKCSYTADFKDEFDRHLRRIHNLTSYVCPHCSAPFSDKYKLNRHLVQERCPEAKKGSNEMAPKTKGPQYAVFNKSSKILNKGLRLALEDASMADSTVQQPHEGSSPTTFPEFKFNCLKCKATFATHREICAHVKTQHAPSLNPGICKFCGLWCTSKYRLWRHMLSSIHDDIDEEELQEAKEELQNQKYTLPANAQDIKSSMRLARMCRLCSKTFPSKEILSQHMQSAHQAKAQPPHVCIHCGKVYARMKVLQRHMKSCTGSKAQHTPGIPCVICNKTFQQNTHVSRHKQALHTPMPQVPADVISKALGKTKETEMLVSGSTQESCRECFVCCEKLFGLSSYHQHMYLHTVWIPHPEHGPQPPDLFDMMYSTNTVPAPENLRFASRLPQRSGTGADTTNLLARAGAEIFASLSPEDKGGETPVSNPQHSVALSTIDQTAFSTLVWDEVMQESTASNTGMATEPSAAIINIAPDGSCTGSLAQRKDSMSAGDPNVATNQGLFQQPSGMTGRVGNTLEDHAYWGDPEQAVSQGKPPENQEPMRAEQALWNQQRSAATQSENNLIVQQQGSFNWYEAMDDMKEEVHSATSKAANVTGSSPEIEQGSTGQTDEVNHSYLCPYCLKISDSLSDIYYHKVEDHRLLPVFRCVQATCRQVFNTLGDYEQHAAEHSQHAYICGICNDHFDLAKDITIHKGSAHSKVHNLEQSGINICRVCHHVFATKEDLEKHASSTPHHHKCSYCSRIFKTPHDRRDHELCHSGKKSFLCDQCGATFINRVTLSRHRLTHKDPRRHQCDQCDMTFNKAEHLRRHLMTKHSNEKPFACQVPGCGRSYKRKDKLQEHQRMHSTEKPYACEQCGRRYRYKDGLRYHEKTHQRNTKYTCKICKVPFPRPGQLRQHLNSVHDYAMKESYVHHCPHCSSAFARPDRLKRHLEKAHSMRSDWTFFCHVCKKGFPGDKSLQTHMEKKHPTRVLGAQPKKCKTEKTVSRVAEPIASFPQPLQPIERVEEPKDMDSMMQPAQASQLPTAETVIVIDPVTGVQHQVPTQIVNCLVPVLTQAAQTDTQSIVYGPGGQQYHVVNIAQQPQSKSSQYSTTVDATPGDSSAEATASQTPTAVAQALQLSSPALEEAQRIVPVPASGAQLATNQNIEVPANQKEATTSLVSISQSAEVVPQQKLINVPPALMAEMLTQLQNAQQQTASQAGMPLPQITLLSGSHLTPVQPQGQVAPTATTIHLQTDPDTCINKY